MPVLKRIHYKLLSLLLSIIHVLLWASSQLLGTTLFPALQGWRTKVVFNLGDSVTSAEVQSWAPWCLSVSQRAYAPSQTHPCLNAKAAELRPWCCHPASPPGLTFSPFGHSCWTLIMVFSLIVCISYPLPTSLQAFTCGVLVSGSLSFYVLEKGPQHCTCMKLI